MFAVLMGAAVAAAVVLIEFGLRLFHRHFSKEYFYPPSRRTVFSIHPEISPSLAAESEFRTNVWGERGDDPPRPDRLYRGLVVGGSAAECALLDQAQSWPMQIQFQLEESRRRGELNAGGVYVGSMSRSGLDVKGIRLALSRLQPLNPPLDFIVVHCGPSDFTRWMDYGTPADGRVPAMSDVQVLQVCRSQQFGFKPKSSALAFYARKVAGRLFGRVERRRIGRYPVESRKLRAASLPHVPLAVDPQPFFDEFRNNLLELVESCRIHARHVIILPQLWLAPAQPSPETEAMLWFGRLHRAAGDVEGEAKFLLHSEVERLFAGVYDIAAELAAIPGVHALPLRGSFPQEPRYFYDDDHFTPEGAALTGRLLAGKILDIEASSQL